MNLSVMSPLDTRKIVLILYSMSGTENITAVYSGVRFYAELTRKGGKRAGTIHVVNPAIKNGICMMALGVTRGAVTGKDCLPIATWTSPEYLANKCEEIDEVEARKVDAAMMKAVDAYERSEEYRTMYHLEIKKPGRTKLQDANASGIPTAHKFYEMYGA